MLVPGTSGLWNRTPKPALVPGLYRAGGTKTSTTGQRTLRDGTETARRIRYNDCRDFLEDTVQEKWTVGVDAAEGTGTIENFNQVGGPVHTTFPLSATVKWRVTVK